MPGKPSITQMLPVLALIGVLIAGLVGASGARAEQRLALVVGNSAYTKVSALPNPVSDAKLIADSLTRAGFDVTVALDVTQRDLKRAVRDFSQKLESTGPDGVGLFYYAGHGLQVNGTNYLVPVDAGIETEGDVAIETVSLNDVMSALAFSRARLTFVVLDACRDNPYKRGFRSVQRGLALVDAPRGSLIAYATSPGDVAADGSGANSPYTAALAELMDEPGVPVEQVFKKVRIRVAEATDGKQLPWESSSLTGDFYFKTGAAADGGGSATVTPPPVETKPVTGGEPQQGMAADAELAYLDAIAANDSDSYRQFLADHPGSPRAEQVRRILQSQVENELWKNVSDENSVASYQRYLAAFPKGIYAEEAGQRMAGLLNPGSRPSVGADTGGASDADTSSGADTGGADTSAGLAGPGTSDDGQCGHPHGNWRVIDIQDWDTLFVRSGPGKSYDHIDDLPYDATGVGIVRCRSVSGYSQPWCEVRYKCVTGWVYQRYLVEGGPVDRSGPTQASAGGSYHVVDVGANDVLNVRAGPGTQYDLVGTIPPNGSGIELRSCRSVSGQRYKWCIVKYRSVEGWASGCCLADSSGRKIQ